MNEFDMIVAVVLITMVSVVLMVRYKYQSEHGVKGEEDKLIAHNRQLEQQVSDLRERVQTLERIAIEKEDSLTRQIEQLRDR